VQNEDLIGCVLARLQAFQKGEFACRENALAITKLEEALLWLRARTNGREQRGVEGTSAK
jgi:predicted deacetylase